jgi:hypothetical protein
MQSLKRLGRTAPKRQQSVFEPEPEGVEPDALDGEELDAYDTFEMYRVICPDCAQPIALLADEERLPEHALCASPWNPFGLTVCAGTGRAAADAQPADETMEVQEQETALLLTLPGARLADPALLARGRPRLAAHAGAGTAATGRLGPGRSSTARTPPGRRNARGVLNPRNRPAPWLAGCRGAGSACPDPPGRRSRRSAPAGRRPAA